MARPRRKHIQARDWARSRAGRAFLALLDEALGTPWQHVPVAFEPSRAEHRFALHGPLGAGRLCEQQEVPEDGCWRSRVVFEQRRWTLEGSGRYRLTFERSRPDPVLYADAGLAGPPTRVSKAVAKRWWAEETARVGDARDTLEETFAPEADPVPLDLARGMVARAGFMCVDCSKPAATVSWWPAGEPCIDIHPDEDHPSLDRVTVAFGGRYVIWSELPGYGMFDEALEAIRAHDPRALSTLNPSWTPFWCEACDECYCAEHREAGPARACPQGHTTRGEQGRLPRPRHG